jgi:hypothetical protein
VLGEYTVHNNSYGIEDGRSSITLPYQPYRPVLYGGKFPGCCGNDQEICTSICKNCEQITEVFVKHAEFR